MLETIAGINILTRNANVEEVRPSHTRRILVFDLYCPCSRACSISVLQMGAQLLQLDTSPRKSIKQLLWYTIFVHL